MALNLSSHRLRTFLGLSQTGENKTGRKTYILSKSVFQVRSQWLHDEILHWLVGILKAHLYDIKVDKTETNTAIFPIAYDVLKTVL